uniref:PD-(D/E)XK nuclease-like domain-containing protein n=1 Tax=Fusarium oxysporum (strain Fo5176) TaxID=660025 RepID=A0A0D2YD75_FUSOF
MHIDAIYAWIVTIDPTTTSTDFTGQSEQNSADIDFYDALLNKAKRKKLPSPSMSSPSKRQRLEDSDPFVDCDATPRRPVTSAPDSILSNSAPSFDIPVRFTPEKNLRAALPSDAHDLYDALVTAEYCEAILPAALKDVPGLELPDTRPYMWQQADKTTDNRTNISIVDKNSRFQEIIERSNESSKLRRSEAAWNSHVHWHILSQLAETSSVRVEDITSARIVPRFRPCFTASDDFPDETGSSSTGSYSTNSNTSASRVNTAKSVHKMVDFALVLEPDQDLAAIIERLTKFPHDATVNQTAYFPLKNRPAPVFIETKTAAGNGETADVQLGIWIAAWHGSMRSLMKRGGMVERIITVPLIQVTEGRWTVMFAVDAGSEIQIAYRDFKIGSSDGPIGMYQLQAALLAITKWMEGAYKTWITRVVSRALAQPQVSQEKS